jgi:hypothetical protein
MKHLLEFVISANHTNAILISAPSRYDLMSNSCVKNGIETFNGKLRKSLERFGKGELIDVFSERNLFTNRATSELGGQRKHGKEESLNCRELAQ